MKSAAGRPNRSGLGPAAKTPSNGSPEPGSDAVSAPNNRWSRSSVPWRLAGSVPKLSVGGVGGA